MSHIKALVIDDEPDIRELLQLTLNRMDINTDLAGTIAEAKQLIASHDYQLCLTDMRLPDGNGIDLVKLLQAYHPDVPVAVITAHGNMDIAVEAMKAGAFDFLSKPVDLSALRKLVTAAVDASQLEDAVEGDLPRIIGGSEPIMNLQTSIRKLARSQAPVYISGESGSGKTTLLKVITGELEPISGSVRYGPGVKVGYFSQEQETLDPQLTVLEQAGKIVSISETLPPMPSQASAIG